MAVTGGKKGRCLRRPDTRPIPASPMIVRAGSGSHMKKEPSVGQRLWLFNTTGVGISQGRAIRLVALDDSGKLFVMRRDFFSLLPGVPR